MVLKSSLLGHSKGDWFTNDITESSGATTTFPFFIHSGQLFAFVTLYSKISLK